MKRLPNFSRFLLAIIVFPPSITFGVRVYNARKNSNVRHPNGNYSFDSTQQHRRLIGFTVKRDCYNICKKYKNSVTCNDTNLYAKVENYSLRRQMSIPINCWNTDNVTRANLLFYKKDTFDSDVSCWNMSGVTAMVGMFEGASNFNSDVSSWDVSSVRLMGSMFEGASNFNSDISNWDVSSVTDMNWMFRFAKKFNNDISSWDVTVVTSMMAMFYQASKFNTKLCNWVVKYNTNTNEIFDGSKCKRNSCLDCTSSVYINDWFIFAKFASKVIVISILLFFAQMYFNKNKKLCEHNERRKISRSTFGGGSRYL